MENEKKTTTETAAPEATPEATPEEQANQETEAVKAMRDVYETRLKAKENEIFAMKKAHADQIRELLKGKISAGDSADEVPEEDEETAAARRIAEKYKIRRL